MNTTYRLPKALAFGFLTAVALAATTATPASADEPVTAIDVLLEPDATMVKNATVANKRLRENYPKGFSLDESHRPHVTTVQRFVKTADLDKVYAALGKVLAEEKPAAWKLKAYKYYYVPFDRLGLAGIVVEPTDDLIRFQKKVIDAVAPFTVKSGTAKAFATTKEDPDVNKPTIDYVEAYVPTQVGKKFNPHVTVGLAKEDYLKKLLGEKFEAFTFSPVGLSVYQLGNFGTARKNLKSWDLAHLPSWKDTAARKAILSFVEKVTTPNSPDFVPPADRIAVFDNDGTLWCEQPIPVQLAFALDRVKALADKHPEWKKTEPFKSALAGDVKGVAATGEKGLVQLITATHAGMTTDEFAEVVRGWLAKARHPKFDRPYTECVYQPMLEILAYLRANGFKTYVVSGGGIEFIRVFAEKAYGIPPEQVIGSTIKTKYEVREKKPVLVRLSEIDFNDDKAGKPVAINKFIGRRPVMAFGNSDGDFEMLEWTTAGSGPRFGLLVHHTDDAREYAYDRKSVYARLARGLDEAAERKWIVADMKKEWKRVFLGDK